MHYIYWVFTTADEYDLMFFSIKTQYTKVFSAGYHKLYYWHAMFLQITYFSLIRRRDISIYLNNISIYINLFTVCYILHRKVIDSFEENGNR